MYRVQVAAIAHEINRAYCEAIGDNSQPIWMNAPEWQCESAMNSVDFHLDGVPDEDGVYTIDGRPEASHENWMKEKVADGWVYGEVKDPEKKTHPCIVPFNELPQEQQVKDSLFSAVVNSLAPFLDGSERSR